MPSIFSTVFEEVFYKDNYNAKCISVAILNKSCPSVYVDLRVKKLSPDKTPLDFKNGVCLTMAEFMDNRGKILDKVPFELVTGVKMPRRLMGTGLANGDFILNLIRSPSSDSFVITDADIAAIKLLLPKVDEVIWSLKPFNGINITNNTRSIGVNTDASQGAASQNSNANRKLFGAGYDTVDKLFNLKPDENREPVRHPDGISYSLNDSDIVHKMFK